MKPWNISPKLRWLKWVVPTWVSDFYLANLSCFTTSIQCYWGQAHVLVSGSPIDGLAWQLAGGDHPFGLMIICATFDDSDSADHYWKSMYPPWLAKDFYNIVLFRRARNNQLCFSLFYYMHWSLEVSECLNLKLNISNLIGTRPKQDMTIEF